MIKANQRVKNVLRSVLPLWARHMLAGGANLYTRVAAWLQFLRVASGLLEADSKVIRRSALRAPFAMLRDLQKWREPELVSDADISIRGVGIFSIRGGSDDLGHVLPSANESIFNAMRRFLQPGDVAIDAGANIGAVSVFLAHEVGPTGRVVAVEMVPETAKRLLRNISLNRLTCVDVVQKALSNAAGGVVMAEIPEGLFGQASIDAGANAGKVVRRLEVPTTTLDTIASGIAEIAVLKLDLEGAEPLALAGASQTLRRTRAVIFESWQPDGGATANLLVSAGFEISRVDGRNYLGTRQRDTEHVQ